jgi:glycosyltransferase involved in cell wall biosynthesis
MGKSIVLLTSSFPVARAQIHAQAPFLDEFLSELSALGVGVTVFTQDQPGAAEGVFEGVEVVRFPWPSRGRALGLLNPANPKDAWSLVRYFASGRQHLLRLLERRRPDALLALWAVPAGWLALQASRRFGTPYGVWALGSDVNRLKGFAAGRLVLRRVFRGASWRWADGFGLAEDIRSLAGVPCAYLATARRLPRPDPAPIEGLGDRPAWLFVGRLEAVKGVDVLVRAMVADLRQGGRDNLWVVGEGSLGKALRQEVQAAGLAERICFLGAVSDAQLATLYRRAHGVVIPSRSESLPLVFGEALRAGKRLVVSDVGDMGRLGRQYGAARVVPPEAPEALMAALKAPADPGPSGRADTKALLDQLDVRRSARQVMAALTAASPGGIQ